MSETTNKLKSRKFIAWAAASIFFAASLIYGFITKADALALAFIPWWGTITVVYLGANAAGKFAPAKPEAAEEPATTEE